MRRHLTILFVAGLLASPSLPGGAQTPAPVAVEKPAAVAPVTNATATTLEQLQVMQATNAATIKQQEAALATLDELQKAAEEIKIYSKRG